MSLFHRDHDAHRPDRIATIVLATVLGFAAGGVGMLYVSSFVIPPSSPSNAFFPVVRERKPSTVTSVSLVDGLAAAARASVQFFDAAAVRSGDARSATEAIESSLLPVRAIASGIVLTSDGWMLSAGDAFPAGATKAGKAAPRLVAVIAGKRYAVSRTVRDPFSGVVFVKTEAVNLPVSELSDLPSLASGERLYSFDAAGGFRNVDVMGVDERPPSSSADLLRSSERLQKILRVTSDKDLLPGAMLTDKDGRLAALYLGDASPGAAAIPLASFADSIPSVLRNGEAGRPYLGIRYVDLSNLVGVKVAGIDREWGALVTSAAGVPAVAKRSPAEQAGIREGDIIVEINDAEVTGNRAVSDIIAEYVPGSTVTLTVVRRNTVREVEVVLESTP